MERSRICTNEVCTDHCGASLEERRALREQQQPTPTERLRDVLRLLSYGLEQRDWSVVREATARMGRDA